MKRAFVVAALLLMATFCSAQTTPCLGLQIPAFGTQNWNVPLYNNFALPLDNYFSGVSAVPCPMRISGGLTLSGPGLTSNTGAFSGNVTVGGTLGVTGSTTLGNSLSGTTFSFSSNGTVGGTLGVTGATTISSSLGLTGTETISGTGGLVISGSGGFSTNTGSTSGNFQVGGILALNQPGGTPPISTSNSTPVASLTLANHFVFYSCGATGSGGGACANTQVTSSPAVAQGSMQISSGTASITGISYFQHSMSCVGTNQTNANPFRVASSFLAGNSTVSATGTNGDVIFVICTGS